MNLENLISSNAVLNNPDIKSKKRALELLASMLAAELVASNPAEAAAKSNPSAAEEDVESSTDLSLEIFQVLTDREKLGSTSMGHGIALPHARSSLTNTTLGAFLKLDKGIDFDSPDQQPTDLIFALLVPEHSTDEHLKVLAYLASLFSNEDFCANMRNQDDSQAIHQNLIHWHLASQAS